MEKDQENFDDLDHALDQFDNQLNLTGNQDTQKINDDPETQAKVNKEFKNFMSEMKNLGFDQNPSEKNFDGLTEMLNGLLSQLSNQPGMEGQNGNQIGKSFEEMFKSLQSDNIQQAAGKLLNSFMDKNLLYEPLVEARQHYEEYFKNKSGNIPQQDQQRYKKQYSIIAEILVALDTSPDEKQKLIEFFEKLQQLGQPPQGISSMTAFT